MSPSFDSSDLPAVVLKFGNEGQKEEVDPQNLIQRVGQLLQMVIMSNSVSPACLTALGQMADSGKVLALPFVEEIKQSGALSKSVSFEWGDCQEKMSSNLLELRNAIASCVAVTTTSTPVIELITLWSDVHDAITGDFIEKSEALFEKKAAETRDTLNSKEVGKLLALALSASTSLASAFTHSLREAIQMLANAGTPLSETLTAELQLHLTAIHEALSEQDWAELCAHLLESRHPQWRTLAEAANKVSDLTTKESTLVAVEVHKVFDSPFSKVITDKGLSGLDGVFGQSRESVDAALDALRGVGLAAAGTVTAFLARAGLPPLLRLEIARDYFQTVGLFFSGLYTSALNYIEDHHIATDMSRFLNGVRSIYDVASINVLQVVENASISRDFMIEISMWVLITAVGVVYLSYLWFVFSGRHLHRRDDEVRQGHEAETWAELANKRKKKIALFTFVITACLTIYLPLTRLCLELLVPRWSRHIVNVNSLTSSSSTGTRTSDLIIRRFYENGIAILIVASFLVATFTLPLPKLLVRLIAQNRPTGSLENSKITYDLDGEEVPFDDKVYERLVQRDPNQLRCPYRSLYAGFEQRWSYFKVLQLLVKLVLALVIVITPSDDMVLRAIILCAFYACVVALSSYSTPFTDPLNNVMEISGKVTALTTCIGGLVAVSSDIQKTKSRTLEVVAIVYCAHCQFFHHASLLLRMPNARLWVKNVLGWITFSDTCRGIDDAPAKDVLPHWDLEREVKHRVWHGFWRALLLQMGQESDPSNNIKIIDRLTALEQAIVASGIHRVRAHWKGEVDVHNAWLRQTLRRALEGLDVYWDDATGTRDGHLDSKSCFGKMYVIPYPFHCVVVYDDCNDETILRDDVDPKNGESKLAKLLFLNFTPRIMAKRELRHKLRVLSTQKTWINFPFSRVEQVTVPDGVIQTTDANGVTHTQVRFSTVSFVCYYTCGVIGVSSNGDAKGRIMAEGFKVSMTYRDGHGKAVAPNTGMVYQQSDRVAVMRESHIGLTSAMIVSTELRQIFDQTKEVWEAGLPELCQQHQEYRQCLQAKHAEANATLTDAFWYFVYNDANLSREQLEEHFKHRETNPQLKLQVAMNQVALDSLYLRIQFIHSHPTVTFWYIFWDDVYVRNVEMRRLYKFKQDLDPRQPTSICYHVMRRPQLEAWLQKRQLIGTKRLFHPHMLDLLYQEMERRLKGKNIDNA
ncbi:LOW QUALITY PROTEIN: Hypothetical protein PHPALM_36476 [Phytophthora palmivora]|uniref:Transmembrane protein n=1 Tax=Phytophthora palmivora TaxID=4796 RepID=A0A2P4WZW8_9STRA|nr:LOW QUALITY PROTEIN: Hypothetical protein PHPALM_36476 [Phytophthora palmivora]